jgi:hypothetical protein
MKQHLKYEPYDIEEEVSFVQHVIRLLVGIAGILIVTIGIFFGIIKILVKCE